MEYIGIESLACIYQKNYMDQWLVNFAKNLLRIFCTLSESNLVDQWKFNEVKYHIGLD